MESSPAHLTGVENRLEIRKLLIRMRSTFLLVTRKYLSRGRTELMLFLLGYAGLIFFRHLPEKV